MKRFPSLTERKIPNYLQVMHTLIRKIELLLSIEMKSLILNWLKLTSFRHARILVNWTFHISAYIQINIAMHASVSEIMHTCCLHSATHNNPKRNPKKKKKKRENENIKSLKCFVVRLIVINCKSLVCGEAFPPSHETSISLIFH